MAVGMERLLLIIDADAKGAVAGLKATGTAAEANLGVVQQQSAAAQAAMVGVGIGAAYAGGRVLTSLDGAVKAASNLNETVQFSQQVFGRRGADEIAKWAKTADDALGQSQNEATEAATTFAVFGKAAHVATGELPNFSKGLVQLAADMASAKNTTPEQAIDAVASALQGRTRPIREYGVLLSDATLKQKAFELGLRDSAKGILSPQERVLATVASLYEQTGKNGSRIQGDFARTADQLANSQRRSAAAAENAAAAFGKGLLPVWKAGSAAGRELLGIFNDLPAAAQSTIAIGAFGAATAATVGGLVTLGAYALPKVAAGWQKVGVAFDSVTGRELAAVDATERLALINDKAAESAERLALAEKEAAETAVTAATEAAAPISAVGLSEAALLASGAAVGWTGKGKKAASDIAEATAAEARQAAVSEAAAADLYVYEGALAAVAEQERLLAVSVEEAAAAEEAAQAKWNAFALSQEAGASRLAGLAGTLGKAGGITLTTVIGVDFALQGIDKLAGIEGKLKNTYRHLQAEATDGGRNFLKAFAEAARAEESKPEWTDIFHIGEWIANRFQLGGVGRSSTATYFKRTFENLLDTEGPKAARSFLDDLKKVNDEQDHSSDSYKRTNALIKEWTRLVRDAEKAGKAQSGATDDQAKSVDRFGIALDKNKSKAKNWADNLGAATSPILDAMDAIDAFNQATEKHNQASSTQPDPFGIADSASAVAAAQRGQAEAARDLAGATRRVQEARAALAHVGDDPTRRKAATDALSSAEDAYASALDRSKSAADQSASAARALDSARAGQISQANALADAEDRIASARRSQAEAQRELNNATRDLAEKEAELAHVNPLRDPNRYRDLSAQVADLRDQQANARDRVADAADQTSAAQRGLLQTQAEAKVQQDQLAASGDDVVKSLIAEQQKLAELYDFIKSHPDAIPGLKNQIQDWADQGLIAQSVADQWTEKLDALGKKADEVGGKIAAAAAATQLFNQLRGIAHDLVFGGGSSGPSGSLPPDFPLTPGAGSTTPGPGYQATHPAASGGPAPSGGASAAAFLNSFPKNPTVGTTGKVGGKWFTWNGTTWVVDVVGSGGAAQLAADGAWPSFGVSSGDKIRFGGTGQRFEYEHGSWTPYAAGGLIPGIGNQDTHPAMLTPGEYVIRKDAVDRVGTEALDRLNAGQIDHFAAGGYVAGTVSRVSFPTPTQTFQRDDGDLTARIAAAVAQAIAQLPRGDEHIHIDQTGYERPPTVSDTVRGVRAGKFLATRR
jgi:hypothetical protein